MRTQNQIYNELFALLTTKQASRLVGGSMRFVDKAKRAKELSKSKRVHKLADEIISLELPCLLRIGHLTLVHSRAA
jgi:hypothetical protein